MAIPPRIRLTSFQTISMVHAALCRPLPMVRTAVVYWGPSGTGKSRRAWEEAGWDAYSQNPRSKFCDGYNGEKHVVIDEFRGGIDVAHILRWTDRYPVRVDVKGSAMPWCAERIWFTSNLHPLMWYPGLDSDTYAALERRMEITELK